MRIQHDAAEMNVYRNDFNNINALAKNLEKLSSGYKINRAGGSAAKLVVSEKMCAQITGLETARRNFKDSFKLLDGSLETASVTNAVGGEAAMSTNYIAAQIAQYKVVLNGLDKIRNAAITKTSSLAVGAPAAGRYTSGAAKTGLVVTVSYRDADGADKTKDITFDGHTDAAGIFTKLSGAINADATLSGLFAVSGGNTGVTLTAKTGGANKGAVTGLTIKEAKSSG